MDAWQIALGWIIGGTGLYIAYRVACFLSDRHIDQWTEAVDTHATVVAEIYGDDLSMLDRLDGVGSGR